MRRKQALLGSEIRRPGFDANLLDTYDLSVATESSRAVRAAGCITSENVRARPFARERNSIHCSRRVLCLVALLHKRPGSVDVDLLLSCREVYDDFTAPGRPSIPRLIPPKRHKFRKDIGSSIEGCHVC